MRSLRRFLIISVLSILALVTFLASLQGYRASMAEAQALFDQQLSATAERLLVTPLSTSLASPAADSASASAFQLLDHHGQILWRSSSTPETMITAAPGFSETNFNGYRWRVLRRQSSTAMPYREVIVAERSDLRFRLAESVVLQSVIPVLLALPATGLLIWMVVGYGLRSLRELAQQLKYKATDDFSPLAIEQPPQEVKPLVDAVNHSLQRLGDAFERERRFSADAAHELRTPISAISMHVHNGLTDPASAGEVLLKLAPDVERLSHLVEQLLLLSRTSAAAFPSQFIPLKLSELARETIARLYPEFEQRHQQIALLGIDGPVLGDRFTLQILLENLLRNAIKYCPDGAVIEVIIEQSPTSLLTVRDNGPGIASKVQQRIFERFYRVDGDRHSSRESGCGLGLSIVSRIAELHGAQLSTGPGIGGAGLAVHLLFPESRETASLNTNGEAPR